MSSLNIVHVAPPFLALDELMACGGVETIINKLRAKQHSFGYLTEVLGPSDSTVAGLIPTVPSLGMDEICNLATSQETIRKNKWSILNHIVHIMEYAKKNDCFFHVHDDYLLPFLPSLLERPFLFTAHNPYPYFWQTEDHPNVSINARNVVAVSKAHQKNLESHGFKVDSVVYNGLEPSEFPFHYEKDDFLLSLSTITPHKGQHTAIEVAKSTGKNLIIAGNIADPDYFKSFEGCIQFDLTQYKDKLAAYKELPLGQKIVYVGPVNDEQKKPLYADAAGFIMPMKMEEPFGLVMIEALACGTPVLAFDRGAAPEIVQSGINGYICQDVNQMVQRVADLKYISPSECRRTMAQNFSLDKMARDYLRLYDEIAREQTNGTRIPT